MNKPILKAKLNRGGNSISNEPKTDPYPHENRSTPIIASLINRYRDNTLSDKCIGNCITGMIRTKFFEGLNTGDDKLAIDELLYVDKILFDSISEILTSELKYHVTGNNNMRMFCMQMIDNACSIIDYSMSTEGRDAIEAILYEFFDYV